MCIAAWVLQFLIYIRGISTLIFYNLKQYCIL